MSQMPISATVVVKPTALLHGLTAVCRKEICVEHSLNSPPLFFPPPPPPLHAHRRPAKIFEIHKYHRYRLSVHFVSKVHCQYNGNLCLSPLPYQPSPSPSLQLQNVHCGPNSSLSLSRISDRWQRHAVQFVQGFSFLKSYNSLLFNLFLIGLSAQVATGLGPDVAVASV